MFIYRMDNSESYEKDDRERVSDYSDVIHRNHVQMYNLHWIDIDPFLDNIYKVQFYISMVDWRTKPIYLYQ